MKRLVLCLALLLLAAAPACDRLPRAQAAPSGAAPSRNPPQTCPPASGRQEALSYFAEIAFGSEYGMADDRVRKWNRPVLVAVHGNPTEEDMAALARVMDGLNAVDGFPGIDLAQSGQNMDVWFVPLSDMPGVVPGYVQGNWGFFTVLFSRGAIGTAAIAIASDVTDQTARNHLLYEEILQASGIMKDSGRYADSIYYTDWTTVQQPTALDWELVRMLYSPDLKPGMPKEEALGILEKESPSSAR